MSSGATKSTDGYVSRYINRRFSTPITNFIVRHNIPLTPNQVSVISFLIGAACLPFYLLGHPIIAGILVQVSSIVDGVDGELARILNMSSKFGAFLDAVLDRLADVLAVLGAALYLSLKMPISPPLLAVFMLAVSGSLMVSYLHIRTQHDLGKHPMFIGKLWNLSSRDVRLFIIFLGSVTGFLLHALVLVAILANFYAIAKFLEIAYLTSRKTSLSKDSQQPSLGYRRT